MQTKKVLIVGLGSIGQMYRKILQEHNKKSNTYFYNVVSVDPEFLANPNFIDFDDLIVDAAYAGITFDLAIICCPNYLHEEYVRQICRHKLASTILVEKPGLENSSIWKKYVESYPHIKIIMVKNNTYRDDLITGIKKAISLNLGEIKEVKIDWLNVDRIPNPGSWFTTKKLAWGGVSRDLMPHLLSMYNAIFEDFKNPDESIKLQRFDLDEITSTEYGRIDKDGTYDVDDYSEFQFNVSTTPILLRAAWKSALNEPKIGITIEFKSGGKIDYDFGFCPESAYYKMIVDALEMSEEKYKEHNEIDYWIHKVLENAN